MMRKIYTLKMWLGAILWVLSLIALVFAWIASFRPTGTFVGLPVAHLYWDALVLGVLAIGAKAGHYKHHMPMKEGESMTMGMEGK